MSKLLLLSTFLLLGCQSETDRLLAENEVALVQLKAEQQALKLKLDNLNSELSKGPVCHE